MPAPPPVGRPDGPPPGVRGGPPRRLEAVDDCAALVLPADAADPAPAVAAAEAAGCWPILAAFDADRAEWSAPPAAAVVVPPAGADAVAVGFASLTGGQEPSRIAVLRAGAAEAESAERIAAAVASSKDAECPVLTVGAGAIRCVRAELFAGLRDGTLDLNHLPDDLERRA